MAIDPKNPPTNENGAPAVSEEHSLTVGTDGPVVLHDIHLVETLAHFNRERVPERSPHAKGSGAFGELEITGDVSAYTKADFLQPGRHTPMAARFSTVAGEQGSPDTWRDVRGFALKFYTQQGNFDMVGNNTPIFFVRDPMKFPHFIRSQKRLPDSGLRSPNMQWDFWTLSPESAHQVSYLMGPRGLPRDWRHMNGYSSHTYSWINAQGKLFWVKYHFITDQGVENMSNAEAMQLAGKNAEYHREDLFSAIAEGNYPSWTFKVQIMPYEDAAGYRFNPFDLTKVWPHKDYPLIEVGKLQLNRNPDNFFGQIEQMAVSPSNTVPGTGFSPDKMLLGRVFAYNDAARTRIGPNFEQLEVNRPIIPTNTYTFDGHMRVEHSGNAPVYAPNSYGRPWAEDSGTADDSWENDGDLVRSAARLHAEDDDFGQAHSLVHDVFSDQDRADLVDTLEGQIVGTDVVEPVKTHMIEYWTKIDEEVGTALAKRV